MPRIAEFLELYPKINTQKAYRSGLRLFFDIIYQGSRVKNDDTHYEALADRYFAELEAGSRSVSSDMITLANTLQDKPPLTARQRIASVKEFFAYNGIDLTTRDLKNVKRRIPKGYAQTEEAELDRETLKRILQHCNLRSRAMFLVMVSSGMRVGEAIQITLNDLDLEKSPARINIKAAYTKTREARIAFMSTEAVEAVRAWLTIRTAHMESSENRNAGLVAHGLSAPKKKDDTRLFPYSYSNVDLTWENAIKAANLFTKDDTTGRKQLHIHQLRKFFRTQAATKIPVDLAEAMMGHSGYLTRAYRKYTRDQLAEFYRKAEPALSIFATEDLETRERVLSLSEENKGLKAGMDELRQELMAVRAVSRAVREMLIEDPSKAVKLKKALEEGEP